MDAKRDQAEGQRFASGCIFVLVGIGVILAAFALGVYSTYRQYRANPTGFEKKLMDEYHQMEQSALEKEQAKSGENSPEMQADDKTTPTAE